MRDPEILIELLKAMANKETGSIPILGGFRLDPNTRHHADLLVDAGHAEWNESKNMLRITIDGYDFLNAIDKQPNAMERFSSLLTNGSPYVDAALSAVDVAKKILGI